jgi:hypothetical protein
MQTPENEEWNMDEEDRIIENLPEHAFDLLDAAQRLLQKLDGISTTDFEHGAEAPEREALRKVVEQITGTSEFVPRLSSEQYAQRQGDQCPRCLSRFIRTDPPIRPEHGVIELHVRCQSCAVHWTEVYRLEGYTDLGF